MTDYIKREDAIKAFDPSQRQDWYTPWIVETLEGLPSADVAPVRHGRWKEIFYGEAGGYTFFNVVCNCCGYDMGDKMTPFCPNCGTKMDGELIRDERIF